MKIDDLVIALRHMSVETGSLVCLGCGHEHNCGIHGCAVLREAADRLDEKPRDVEIVETAGGDRWGIEV